MERVTGIEPALSAWELSEHMGVCWSRCGFRGHERPGLSLGGPRQWHVNGTVSRGSEECVTAWGEGFNKRAVHRSRSVLAAATVARVEKWLSANAGKDDAGDSCFR